ncbi:MAG: STAS domain-containing protein [Phycisphaerae bacterium]|nr:STAS domain-containing protein [Phycisphaerae bacterium]
MSKTPSYLRISKHGTIIQVDFTEKHILDEATIRNIGDELVRLVDSDVRPRIVISFRHVEHLSSSALGTLLNINTKVRAKEGQLRLCDIRPEIAQIFEITKLNRILKLEKDVTSARASLEAATKA